MQAKLAIGIGEVLWDIFPAKNIQIMGGAPANFTFHTAQMGLESILISAIGKDNLGNELIHELQQHKIKHQLQQGDYETGSVLVNLDHRGIPSYEIKEPVAWDYITINDTLIASVKQASAICFGSLAQRHLTSHEAIIQLVNHTPKDALRIFDINLRQHFFSAEVVLASLKACTILKLNEDELLQLPNILNWTADNEINTVQKINASFPNIHTIIITKGEEGSIIYNQEGRCLSELATPNIKIVDTVGAGDAFTAAYTACILKGQTINDAHKKAVEIAAFVCSNAGAIPVHP